jgi:hypothetical protein
MAKGQKRSNREHKKPKQEKPKATPSGSPFAPPGQSGASPRPAGSKK